MRFPLDVTFVGRKPSALLEQTLREELAVLDIVVGHLVALHARILTFDGGRPAVRVEIDAVLGDGTVETVGRRVSGLGAGALRRAARAATRAIATHLAEAHPLPPAPGRAG